MRNSSQQGGDTAIGVRVALNRQGLQLGDEVIAIPDETGSAYVIVPSTSRLAMDFLMLGGTVEPVPNVKDFVFTVADMGFQPVGATQEAEKVRAAIPSPEEVTKTVETITHTTAPERESGADGEESPA